MTCGKCGTKLPEGASFCMTCGSPIAREPVAPGAQPAKKGVNPWAIISTLLAVLVLILFFLLRKPSDLKIVDNGSTSANLRVPAKGDVAVTMPDDVMNWLKHLQKIEEKKNELEVKQEADMEVFMQKLQALGAGIGEMDPYNQTGEEGQSPSDVTKGKFEDLKPAWEDLITEFQSVPPPKECEPIANDYYAGLSEIPGMTSDINDVLNQVASSSPQQALQKAYSLQNKSYDTIDRSFSQTDKRVQAICDKYNVRKWFNIGERSPIFAKTGASGIAPP